MNSFLLLTDVLVGPETMMKAHWGFEPRPVRGEEVLPLEMNVEWVNS